ncbi:MAG: hypothetical protein IPH20_11500 [Bacteroidales bacterium]|nr:hypothetical protein [Bacteroidales bacterium]
MRNTVVISMYSWRFRVSILTLITGFVMGASLQVLSQEDRIPLKSGSTDSVIIKLPPVRDSMLYELQRKHIESSSEIYKKIKSSAHKNFFSRQLYPLFFKKPPVAISSDALPGADSLPYIDQKDKIIRSIRIYKAPVFGSSVFDTTRVSNNWIDKTLNNLHFYTHDAVIRNYLQIKKGDPLNPVQLSDNERIIRESALFQDARFIVTEKPGTDSVDVVLVIKDVAPLGFATTVKDASNSSIRLFNRNILGFGHQLEQTFEISTNSPPNISMGSGGYKVRNIRRSFTDLNLYWKNVPEMKRIGIQIYKPFVSPETRFGGGINIQKIKSGEALGVSNPAARTDYSVYDIWGGYSTIINRYKSPVKDRAVFAVTGRYYNVNFQHSPPVVLELISPAVTFNRYIAGLSLVRSGYYRSNMIYSFGRTEDIPTGNMAQLTFGYETSIISSRYYTGVKLLSGDRMSKDRFIYSWFEGGGYWTGNHFNDGIVGFGFDYISGLYKSGSYRFRSFVSLSYKAGINRESIGELEMKSEDFFKTYRKYNESGDQRLGIKAETVVFTPYYLLGFRFAAYSFVEAAMITEPGRFALSGAVYPAIGFGLRIRNENLVFSTIQFGVTWYGRPDINGNNWMFEIADIPQVPVKNFNIGAPEFSNYR